MSNNELQDSDRKHHEEEGAFATNRTDPGRARPVTSGMPQGTSSESKRMDSRSGAQGYNSNERFPTLDSHNRAISAKIGKLPEGGKQGDLRKSSSKPSQSARLYDAPVKTQNFVLHNNKIMPGPNSNEFARIKPKNIMQDKERLYEETLHLKQIVNALKEENLKQKTKINNLEKEATKFEKMMIQESNATSSRDAVAGKTAEGHLAITLKQNVKDLKSDLRKRDDELLEIKKMMKYTKIQELEMQMKAFQDEALRLKTVMDHVLQEKAHVILNDDDKNKLQEEYFVQATQVKTLKRDNEEMATAIKILEEQNFEYEKKITELEKKLKREQNGHKKALQDKDKEIIRLRTEGGGSGNIQSVLVQSGSSKRPVTSLNRDDALRQELEKKTIENNNFLNQLAEKRNQVLTLERQLRDLRAEYNEKITSTQNEKQALLRELDKLRNVKAVGLNDSQKQPVTSLRVQELKLDDYARRASFQRPFPTEEKDSPHVYNTPSGQTSTFSDKSQQKGGPKKRVQKVRPENMKDIGHELNLRLRIKKLTFTDIDRSIWPEKVRKTATVSIKEMIDILKGEPFNMTNEDEIVLTARFLIEDNEHEYLFYEDTAKNDLHIVKSILKKVIGNLPPWDEAKTKKMHEDIAEICVSNYGGLKENLKVLCKSGYLTAEDLKKACNVIEITLTDEQIEYIITKLFEHSDNIHKLSIDRLFEVFTLKPKEISKEVGYITTLKKVISEEDEEYRSSRGNTLENVNERQREEYEDEEEEEEDEEPNKKGAEHHEEEEGEEDEH